MKNQKQGEPDKVHVLGLRLLGWLIQQMHWILPFLTCTLAIYTFNHQHDTINHQHDTISILLNQNQALKKDQTPQPTPTLNGEHTSNVCDQLKKDLGRWFGFVYSGHSFDPEQVTSTCEEAERGPDRSIWGTRAYLKDGKPSLHVSETVPYLQDKDEPAHLRLLLEIFRLERLTFAEELKTLVNNAGEWMVPSQAHSACEKYIELEVLAREDLLRFLLEKSRVYYSDYEPERDSAAGWLPLSFPPSPFSLPYVPSYCDGPGKAHIIFYTKETTSDPTSMRQHVQLELNWLSQEIATEHVAPGDTQWDTRAYQDLKHCAKYLEVHTAYAPHPSWYDWRPGVSDTLDEDPFASTANEACIDIHGLLLHRRTW